MAGFYIKNIMKGETSRVNSLKKEVTMVKSKKFCPGVKISTSKRVDVSVRSDEESEKENENAQLLRTEKESEQQRREEKENTQLLEAKKEIGQPQTIRRNKGFERTQQAEKFVEAEKEETKTKSVSTYKKSKTKKQSHGAKSPRKKATEIYITHEKADFFKADNVKLERFYNLANQSLAINYGYWGAVWRNYLLSTDPDRYLIIRSEQRLYSRIAEIDLEAQKLYDKTIARLSAESANKAQAVGTAKALVYKTVIQNPEYIK